MTAVITATFNEKRMARIQKKLGPEIVMPPLTRLIKDIADLAQREAFTNAPRHTGGLAGAIGAVVSPLSARISVSHPAARVMEGGRKPLVAGGKMPPPDAFIGIAEPGTEFALARSVAQRGIKGRFFFKKAKAKAVKELPNIARRAAAEIAAEWAAE